MSSLQENENLLSDNLLKKSQNYAKASGFHLNPNEKIVEQIIKGLLEREKKYGEKYCPCRRVSGDKKIDEKNICPCIFHKEEIKKQGHCLCLLFVK